MDWKQTHTLWRTTPLSFSFMCHDVLKFPASARPWTTHLGLSLRHLVISLLLDDLKLFWTSAHQCWGTHGLRSQDIPCLHNNGVGFAVLTAVGLRVVFWSVSPLAKSLISAQIFHIAVPGEHCFLSWMAVLSQKQQNFHWSKGVRTAYTIYLEVAPSLVVTWFHSKIKSVHNNFKYLARY